MLTLRASQDIFHVSGGSLKCSEQKLVMCLIINPVVVLVEVVYSSSWDLVDIVDA